jgi:hypothetical protein
MGAPKLCTLQRVRSQFQPPMPYALQVMPHMCVGHYIILTGERRRIAFIREKDCLGCHCVLASIWLQHVGEAHDYGIELFWS